MKNFIKNSRGDTIIEILLSIAVLSLVLSVSYGLANRSSQATRQAQERSEAQKFAEEQLELLRGYVTPDRPWEDDELCFPQNNPSTPEDESTRPTADINDCRRGPVDPNDSSGLGRYETIIEPTAENTFTVRMGWINARGGQDELTLSYKLPVTGDIFASIHRQCSDNEDNDGDSLTDEDDPNCLVAGIYDPDLDAEAAPPPPPDSDGDGVIDVDDVCPDIPAATPDGCPPPFEWADDGREYDFCAPDRTLVLPSGDEFDGCLRTGGSMYAYRNVNFLYNLSNGLKRGDASLRICYQNHSGNTPSGYEGYKLKVTAGHGRTSTITLPPASSTVQKCETVEIFIDDVNPSTLRMIWYNDSCCSGGDANLRINSVKITQNYDEGSSPVSQRKDGEAFSSCQLSGNPGYCLLNDALYSKSVYSLSSDPSSRFKVQYKFNSSITSGSYDLSIAYFNGDHSNLPAPPGYSYNITVSYPGGSRTVSLPIENSLSSRHIRQYTINNINITGSSPTITVQWNNDYYNPGVFDANFGINSILLTKR